MNKCLGVITTDDIDKNFGDLCKHRSSYMLPFGGRYRIIDFALSNMVNHGLGNIAVYTGGNIRSALDHLGNGKPWDLDRRFNGLFLFAPTIEEDLMLNKGEISQFSSTWQFFDRIKEENILLRHPNYLAKVDITEAHKKFKKTDADITLVYKKVDDPKGNLINSNKLYLDEDENLLDIGVNLGTEHKFNHFIHMSFFKKEVFLKLIKESKEKGDSLSMMDAIMKNKDKFKINAYEFKGHVENIIDLKSFYDANLNLLDRNISKEIFYKGGRVFTKTQDEPSTYYTDTGDASNSFIANGCIIKGKVENSVIFRGVKIGKNAIVKNSIIMQKTVIEDNAVVVNSIVDKSSNISKNANIAGGNTAPFVVEKYGRVTND